RLRGEPAKPKADPVRPPWPSDVKGGTYRELPPIGSAGTTPKTSAVDWSAAEQRKKTDAPKKSMDFGTMRPADAKPPQVTPGVPTPIETPKPATTGAAPTPLELPPLPPVSPVLVAPNK